MRESKEREVCDLLHMRCASVMILWFWSVVRCSRPASLPHNAFYADPIRANREVGTDEPRQARYRAIGEWPGGPSSR